MAAFDTNVIVRVLVGDDPVQTRKAGRAFVSHARAEGVYVAGKADLADYLILGKARSAAGRTLLTFDKKLAREKDASLL